MDEDEEEFYDSLEEDLQVDRFQDAISGNPSQYELCDDDGPKKPTTKTKIPVRELKIPLYQGETAKEDLKITKMKPMMKSPTSTSSKTSKTCIACEKPKVKFTEVKKRSGGYWDLYCQKNGTPSDSDGLTSFSGNDNNKIFKSFINSSSCLTGTTWDAPSMFEKYVQKKYTDIVQQSETQSLKEAKLTLDGDFKSVSNMDITKTPRVNNNSKIAKSKSNTSNVSFRPLTLKCIGPDPEKLEQIRKQQDYGKKVSSRNRARIIQNLGKDVLKANK